MQMTPQVRKILSWYESDNPGTKGNIARILMQVVLPLAAQGMVAVAIFALHPAVPPTWRLVVVTGFLGGLTTFSTFSAETVTLLARGQYGWSMAIIAAHLGGSLLMTILGMQTIKWLQQ